jgi:restriction system protein
VPPCKMCDRPLDAPAFLLAGYKAPNEEEKHCLDCRYMIDQEPSGLMLHRVNTLENNAVAPPGTRILTTGTMAQLSDAVGKATVALADAGNWSDPKAVAEQYGAHRLLAQGLAQRFRVSPADEDPSESVALDLNGPGRRREERALRYLLPQPDVLHHRDFEFAVRDLLRRDGCRYAVQVGGANDRGADVIGTDPLGRRWVIQCKHRRDGLPGKPVGTSDLHNLNGTARQLHGADIAVLVTNGRFGPGCPPLAKCQGLYLVDRRTLGEWVAGSRPLWELLRQLPPPSRRPSKPT